MQAHVRAWPADRPLHVCHVSRRVEIELIRRVKQRGQKVTCEVAPHHLFLTEGVARQLGGRGSVRPELATESDRQALWASLNVIDCIATDHAPHTLAEKDGADPPPGFPGLETALGLMLTAVSDGRLTLDQVVERMAHGPRRIFGLPAQPETWIEVDPDGDWEVTLASRKTRCRWSPFAGWKLKGRVQRVVLRGKTVFEGGRVLAKPGSGRNVSS
jgi:dihydroorotase-like cyclic amidohydrolase